MKRSQTLKFENFSDPDPVSKILDKSGVEKFDYGHISLPKGSPI